MQLRYLLRTGQFVFKNTLWTNTTAYVNSISEGHFKHCLLHRSFHKSVTLKDSPRKFVLGIETSCDDTGAAVVDDKGNILGEALNSQTSMTNKNGGVHPFKAKDSHAKNIKDVVDQALQDAQMTVKDVDAIAVTVMPGLYLSLKEGVRYAVELAETFRKPIIPIHHMEAHALTARMIHRIEFPFLVLLVSGGHCLLAVCKDIDEFLVLGTKNDVSPGVAFDRVARSLKLQHKPQLQDLSFGAMVEEMAKQGDPLAFPTSMMSLKTKDCNFYLGGFEQVATTKALKEYEHLNLPENVLLPTASDICAWFQLNVATHMAVRLQRGFLFCRDHKLLPQQPTLVVSGGVASNTFLRNSFQNVCSHYDTKLVCPPIKLCTDNGIMIAWNGMEKLLSGRNYFKDPLALEIKNRVPLGENYVQKVQSHTFSKLPKIDLIGVR